VVALDVGDDCLAALAAMRDLETLDVVAAWTDPAIRRPDELPPVHTITDDGLQRLRTARGLRALRLAGQLGVTGTGLDVVRELPGLEEVSLRSMRVDDAGLRALGELPRLRRLVLEDVQGFGAAGLAAIARLATLEELSLSGCSHVDDEWLVALGGLSRLEVLDLSRLAPRGAPVASHLPPSERGSGVAGAGAAAIATLPRLRSLNLTSSGVASAPLRALGALAGLQHLELDGAALQAADLRFLPRGLARLSLRELGGLLDRFGEDLAAAVPGLQTLDLVHCPGVGRAALASLAALTSLRELHVYYCPRFGPDGADGTAEEAAAAVARIRSLEGVSLRGWMPLGEGALATLRAMPLLRRLDLDDGVDRMQKR
jgi:hypothetical protein